MIRMDRIRSLLASYPLVAAGIYLLLVTICAATAGGNVLDILRQRAALMTASEMLAQIEARNPARTEAVLSDVGVPAGSPFLEGSGASVASASLLRRVTGAIRRARGNILSSQVDLQGPQAKAGFITATSSFEIEPASLLPLLYDLEAGMPFLFTEQLVVQAPSGTAEARKLRVVLAVSGQWQAAK
jgi:general secretion pathway protein M